MSDPATELEPEPELPLIKNLDTGETILLEEYALKPVSGLRRAPEQASRPPLARQDAGLPSTGRKPVKVPSLQQATADFPNRLATQITVKVSSAQRGKRDTSEVKLLQDLHVHTGVIWVAKFNKDGRYLATAGQDAVLRIWEVWLRSGRASQPGSPCKQFMSPRGQPQTCIFRPMPYREYTGHREDILDLSWSRTEFILTSSVDRTVRLWHLSQLECLRVFEHNDIVTSVEFHPQDARRFLTGSVDGKLRLWSTLETRVLGTANLHHDMITAIALLWDTRSWKVLVGTAKGKCRVYDCADNKLDYITQLDVRNTKRSTGKKVTTIYTLPALDKGSTTEARFLVSSNDSRLRLFNGYTQEWKYKGHKNSSTQVRACMSANGEQVMSGSDDGNVYLWSTTPGNDASGPEGKNLAFENFQADTAAITMAVFAPESLKAALGACEELDAQSHSHSPVASAASVPDIIVTVGFTGRVRVFEYTKAPQTDKGSR